MSKAYPKIAALRDVTAFRERLRALRIAIPADDRILRADEESPLARPIDVGGFRVGNRWCVHPMEGWDAGPDGFPSELTLRRWRHFGISGAKWIWGGEAAAVCPEGRANPRQTMATPGHLEGLSSLRETLANAHVERYGSDDGLFVGLQLTHSGRFCRPNSNRMEPRIAYHHPLLDARFGIDPRDDSVVLTDDEGHRVIDAYVASARAARRAGFAFVDVKCCHGYLLHEFLSARRRTGPFGGDLDGRSRMLATIVDRIRQEVPGLQVVVRMSVFDSPPFIMGEIAGRPVDYAHLAPYDCAFGVDPNDPLRIDLDEPIRLIGKLRSMGVTAINVTCGSPYYNPHMQRPAIFPPSDGYAPPEDPLVGVARQIDAARRCQAAYPDLPMVGTGYTYLQDYLPHVAQAVVRDAWIGSVGIGRMVLSYPELPDDCLRLGKLTRKKVCRTFSDCTTAPRKGLVSGCFPLDPFYKNRPEADALFDAKQADERHGQTDD
ncbi:MAG: NADH:flavin oxidoreductase [Planctomycetes bacterium]|nr:NADH:flavin oxidoreductase [Planctomycetota bacterium]